MMGEQLFFDDEMAGAIWGFGWGNMGYLKEGILDLCRYTRDISSPQRLLGYAYGQGSASEKKGGEGKETKGAGKAMEV